MNIPCLRRSMRRLVLALRPARATIVAGSMVLAVGPAPAQIPPQTLARGLALAVEAAAALAPPGARVQAQPGALDPRLTLAPCARVDAYLPTGVPTWGRTRIGLRCSEGRTRWNVFLPVTIQVWAPAMVLATPLPAGARLTDSQLLRAEVDWGSAALPVFVQAEALVGRTLARAMPAGQALHGGDLQARQWFAMGETVRIVASGDGFSITAEGQALSAGLEGQAARVRTDSGRVLVGRAVGERRVEVGL